MLTKIADGIVQLLERRGIIDPQSRDVYVYGCDAALSTLINTAGLLLVGVICHRVLEAMIIIGLFYLNQSTGGGFHASTHLRCFLTMAIGLLGAILTYSIYLDFLFLFLLGFLSLVLLYRYPLVLHANKTYLADKSAVFIRRSRLTICIQAIFLFAAATFFQHDFFQALTVGLTLCAVSRAVAVYIDRLAKKPC